MASKLYLAKGVERDFRTMAPLREDRYRYPASEEVWEVWCEPDKKKGRREPTQSNDTRRAS